MTKIEISKLKKDNVLLIETEKSVYEITVVDPKGTCRLVGGKDFLEETEVLLIGSTGYKGYLVCGECIEFAYTKNNSLAHVTTSKIVSGSISGISAEGQPWTYEVWEGSADEKDSSTSK